MASLAGLVSRKYLHLRKHPFLSGEGNQAKHVLFLFNGMEKIKLDFRIGASELCSDPNEALPPSVVVVNLLRKYLLPEVRSNRLYTFHLKFWLGTTKCKMIFDSKVYVFSIFSSSVNKLLLLLCSCQSNIVRYLTMGYALSVFIEAHVLLCQL